MLLAAPNSDGCLQKVEARAKPGPTFGRIPFIPSSKKFPTTRAKNTSSSITFGGRAINWRAEWGGAPRLPIFWPVFQTSAQLEQKNLRRPIHARNGPSTVGAKSAGSFRMRLKRFFFGHRSFALAESAGLKFMGIHGPYPFCAAPKLWAGAVIPEE